MTQSQLEIAQSHFRTLMPSDLGNAEKLRKLRAFEAERRRQAGLPKNSIKSFYVLPCCSHHVPQLRDRGRAGQFQSPKLVTNIERRGLIHG